VNKLKEKASRELNEMAGELINKARYLLGLMQYIRLQTEKDGLKLEDINLRNDGLDSLAQGIGEFIRTLPPHLQ
jgi:hypothetical protein